MGKMDINGHYISACNAFDVKGQQQAIVLDQRRPSFSGSTLRCETLVGASIAQYPKHYHVINVQQQQHNHPIYDNDNDAQYQEHHHAIAMPSAKNIATPCVMPMLNTKSMTRAGQTVGLLQGLKQESSRTEIDVQWQSKAIAYHCGSTEITQKT